MKPFFSKLIPLLLLAYPLLVYGGLQHVGTTTLASGLLVLLVVRVALSQKRHLATSPHILPISLVVGAVLLTAIILRSERLLLIVPVSINAVLLVSFFATLLFPPSMAERIAALSEPHITPAISRYCRRVTQVWCVFFVFNGTISLITALYFSTEYWTLYNGLISYLLIGTLMGVEYLVRRRVKQTTPSIDTKDS